MLKYEPARMQAFDYGHVNDFEIDIGKILQEHCGFGRTPILNLSIGNVPAYDLLLDFGRSDILRVEVKASCQRWLPIEYEDNGKGVGISATTADIWVFCTVGGTTFDNRGVDIGDGFKVEWKFNIIKPDTIVQFIREHSSDPEKVKHKRFDNGSSVAYINTHALDNRFWFGACEAILREDYDEMVNSSPIKSMDLSTFRRERNFGIERVLHKFDKFDNPIDTEHGRNNSDRLVDIVSRST